jgi:LssY C-terminus
MLPVHLLLMKQVAAGTPLHVRLTSAVGSYDSKKGMAVRAILIAPVTAGDDLVIPAGSTLSGTVTKVNRVGYGIMHETAALGLDFDQLTLPDGTPLTVSTRLHQVDNGRERVDGSGNILGTRATSSIAYRASGYIRTALEFEVHARLALWAVKMLVVQVPEPEIFYPAGSELTLALTEPIYADPQPRPIDTTELTWKERGDLEEVIANLPARAFTRNSKQASDMVNMMFVGSREQITAAFTAAGWSEMALPSMRARIRGLRAVAEVRGFVGAPMSPLFVNDVEPDLAWQKGLNDFAKRDHIRLWKQSETWDGQELWVGAATRDVDFAYFRPGHMFTHQIEQNVDIERDKVAHDLQFTDCADAVDYWDRPGFPHVARNATGDTMVSDAQLAVVRLNGCASPRVTEDPAASGLRMHGGKVQRFVRREILATRNDFYRHNMVFRGYEVGRWTVLAIRKHKQGKDWQQGDFDKSDSVASSGFAKVFNSSWLR